MLNDYESVKNRTFATCTIPDGYDGDRVEVGVALVESYTYQGEYIVVLVSGHGYFRTLYETVKTADEAMAKLPEQDYIHDLHRTTI